MDKIREQNADYGLWDFSTNDSWGPFWRIILFTHNLLDDFVHNASVLQVVKVAGASDQLQLSYVCGLIGFRRDAYGKEADTLVFGVGHGC